MKRIAAVVFLLTVFLVVIVYRDALQFGCISARLTGRATVEDRLRTYEAGARARLARPLENKGYSYPLNRFTLLVIKDVSRLHLFAHDLSGRPVHIKEYVVLAKSGTLGPKLRDGDRQIPEGIYNVDSLNPNSLYHLSLRLDYPNNFDRQMAQRDRRTQLGGDIMIHGKNVSIGCIAIGDPAIEEIFCLAARADIAMAKVIIVPTDWRVEPFEPKIVVGPVWLPELYLMLKTKLDQLPQR